MKKETKNSTRKFILLFGIISAIVAAFLLFASLDMLHSREGYAVLVLTACLGILFGLFSVMINHIATEKRKWSKALLITLAAMAISELIMMPLVGSMLIPAEIILFAMNAIAAIGIFIVNKNHNNKTDARIPLILGIIASCTGILLLNTIAYMIFNGGDTGRLWLGILFAALFLILSVTLTKRAFPENQQSTAIAVTAISALAIQVVAIIYAIIDVNPSSLYIFQVCVLAALMILSAVFIIRMRKPQKTQKKKRSKK